MKQVRLFLYVYSKDTGWAVRVFRDLASLKTDWDKEKAEIDLAVIHIGFDRPDSDSFEKFITSHPSKVLATASARYAMPKKYCFSSGPIGVLADELPVFMALSGWGYECNDESCSESTLTSTPDKPDHELIGWIKDLKDDLPKLAQRAISSGIYDDVTYIQCENELNREDRIQLAKQRIIRLSPDHNLENIINIATYAPPWLSGLLVTNVNLSVRVNNVFAKNNINRVKDLQDWSLDSLLSLPNFGKTSIKVILSGLKEALEKGPSAEQSIVPTEHFSEIPDDPDLSRQERIDNAVRNITQLGNSFGIEHYFNIIQNSPEWLLSREIHTVALSARLQKKFKELDIKTVADLKSWPDDSLLELDNIGKTSITDLNQGIKRALLDGPMVGEDAHKSLEEIELLDHIRRTLNELPDKNQYILKRRMGFEVPAGTLQEVGDELGVTRERIRQIEAKYVRKIIDVEFWDDVLLDKLEAMLEQTSTPLLFFGLSVLDPWFSGVEKHLDAFVYVLDNFCESKFALITVNEQEIVSRIGQNEWDDLVKEAQLGLQSCVDSTLTKQQCKSQIHSLLPPNCLELAVELWISASKNAHFATTSEGECIITGLGRGMESIVEAILTETSIPLHYSKITDIVKQKTRKEVDVRRVHNAAANVGYLFGRGKYGLLQHYPLSTEETNIVIEHTLSLAQSGNIEKQWHCGEICDYLLDTEISFADKITPYIVHIALHQTDQFSYLGRLVWCIKSDEKVKTSDRIEIHQAIASILEDAGQPLTTNQIIDILTNVRGIRGTFQISPTDLIIRMKPGTWGLASRDIPWRPEILKMLIDALKYELHRSQKGIHSTEITNALIDYKYLFTAPNDPTTLMYLAARDEEFSTAMGGFLFLTEWGEPRRLNLRRAVEKALIQHGHSGITKEELTPLVIQNLGRKIHWWKISHVLSKCDAVYDANEEKWYLPSDQVDDYY